MCGIFGAVAPKPSSQLPEWLFFGLSQLQHRGQESAGVAYGDSKSVWIEKGEGLISHILTNNTIADIASHLPLMAIGQNRYSTSKGTSSRNIQPQWLDTLRGRFALVHNGNIPNLEEKKENLIRQTKYRIDIAPEANDTEFMLKKIFFFMEENGGKITDALKKFMATTNGSYSAALLSRNGVYVFRDPWGNRPLFLAKTDKAIFFASETCALRDGRVCTVEPGQVIELIPGKKPKVINCVPAKRPLAQCVFEKIYFARPDSRTFGDEPEGSFRFRLGQKLAKLFPVPQADFVSCLPESGRPAAEGFAYQSQRPIISTYIRNPYILGRTFINPNPGDRASYADRKQHFMEWVLKYARNKSVVLVDDSIMRGVTLKNRIAEMKEAGAKEVHVRISAPPTIYPDYYGIDIPTRGELIANGKTIEQVKAALNATSLEYLSVSALNEVLKEGGENPRNFCLACFTGEYPIPLR